MSEEASEEKGLSFIKSDMTAFVLLVVIPVIAMMTVAWMW